MQWIDEDHVYMNRTTPVRLTGHQWRGLVLLLLLGLVLVSCGDPLPTYVELKQTAVASGCWPGNAPTPPPVTVTPVYVPTTGTINTTTPTALPTTTPLPRCTPAAGAPTLVPWPTALPTPVPLPTLGPGPIQGGSDTRELTRLPGLIDHIDIAVHPTQGWPAVVMTQQGWQGWSDPDHRRIYAQVFDPDGKTWGLAHQVNLPPEEGNANYGGVAVTITGDGTVHVAWGGSFTAGRPVWYSASADHGETWSVPTEIGQHCFNVQDMAATIDGYIVVLALCNSPEEDSPTRPGLIQRQPNGTWLPQQELRVNARWGSLVVFGEGPQARAVALMTDQGSDNAVIIQKRLADPSGWGVQTIDVAAPAGYVPDNASAYLHRGIAFRRPNDANGIVFTWSTYGGNAVFACTSLDGGQSWGPVETVVAHGVGSEQEIPPPLDSRWSAPAYDVRSDRVIMLWTGRDMTTSFPQAATHYGSWSVPGSGAWNPPQRPGNYGRLIPLVTGAERASNLATAQTANASYVWLAWIDAAQVVKVRTIDMNLLVPIDQYAQATPRPTPGAP